MIIFYNGNSIRRVDIQTFEIRKNIDLNKIAAFQPAKNMSFYAQQQQKQDFKKGAQSHSHKMHLPNQYSQGKGGMQSGKNMPMMKRYGDVREDLEIQEVMLMPLMPLDPLAPG